MSTPRRTAKRPGPRNEVSPWKPLTAFLVLLAVVYGLVFFTGGGSAEPKLGIDLQGGTRVTLTARTPDGKTPSKDQLDQAKQIIEKRVNGLGVAGSEVVVNGNNLVITVPGNDGKQARTLGQTARLYVRPVTTVQAAVPQKTDEKDTKDGDDGKTPAQGTEAERKAAQAAIEEQRKLRQAPANADQKRIAELTAQMAKMDCSPEFNDPLRGNDLPDQYLVACSQDGTQVYLMEPQIIDGRDIASASAGTNDRGEWVVMVEFKGKARNFWPEYTGKNIGKQTAFTLDTEVVSAPSINGAITTRQTEITGSFNQSSSKDLANVLKYGSLPLSFEASDAETVSATLGKESLRAGLIAGAVGLIACLLYALAYYRMLGVLTFLSLVLAGLQVYGIIVLLGRWIGFTLDLAGIAGLIIGIGMTADSFVVYFERIKDEIREGRTFRSAVPRGWVSARRTIWTGNMVSLIAAVVIYILAVGEVRGFAFTLGLTTVLDVVVVFLVTHPLVVLATRSPFLSQPKVNGLGAVSEVAAQRKAAARAQAAVKAAEAGEGAVR
ncbi:protein translocase subunit SecD [Gordonia sp. (in: high G+C Gram-positive bacteria)]|uniref:protein translocase subunit SecD n=1 Tax=Gordonia sp. (in: high G+C Gram-positive bacteria) TaxID=84139 RepID=UPI001DA4A52A|nr:protein translocase subunit SecD [Gordonia sp. (in: high G+C Gram-positive bacteria)]MCB1294497.1 protein translocase subunit SecD [Gordonia sp. (in: high G+C Gram-positive bacteria)]HMS76336.1 protein translocase subunit SecD [Gordonia sp. (in: high G+C Gram-positive bacteria)]